MRRHNILSDTASLNMLPPGASSILPPQSPDHCSPHILVTFAGVNASVDRGAADVKVQSNPTKLRYNNKN